MADRFGLGVVRSTVAESWVVDALGGLLVESTTASIVEVRGAATSGDEVSSDRLVSARVLVPLWVVVSGDLWPLSVDNCGLLLPLEESGPDSHVISATTVVTIVA